MEKSTRLNISLVPHFSNVNQSTQSKVKHVDLRIHGCAAKLHLHIGNLIHYSINYVRHGNRISQVLMANQSLFLLLQQIQREMIYTSSDNLINQ